MQWPALASIIGSAESTAGQLRRADGPDLVTPPLIMTGIPRSLRRFSGACYWLLATPAALIERLRRFGDEVIAAR